MTVQDSLNTIVKELLWSLNVEKENLVLLQLNDMIKTGVLRIAQTQPILVQSFESDKMEFKSAVRLTFHGAERLLELEKQNKELQDKITEIQKMVGMS